LDGLDATRSIESEDMLNDGDGGGGQITDKNTLPTLTLFFIYPFYFFLYFDEEIASNPNNKEIIFIFIRKM
jgi:hypothetical protein